MVKCKINDFLTLKLIENDIFIYIKTIRYKRVPFEKSQVIENITGEWLGLEHFFRCCCVDYAKWGFFKYDGVFPHDKILDGDDLLKDLAKKGDKNAINAFKSELKRKLQKDNLNNPFIISILKDENLQGFKESELRELIEFLGPNIKHLIRAINTKSMCIRLIPILEQLNKLDIAKNLVAKLIRKDITFFIDNQYIWDFALKNSERFIYYFPDAIRVLLKRKEIKKAEFLKKILKKSK